MVKDLEEIRNYLKNKDLCLLGNARSILNTSKDIDKFDIVCRMNRAFPKGKEKFIGKRTDVLFLSTTIPESRMIKEMIPKFIVWMVESDKRANNYVKNKAIQNPIEDWYGLKNSLTLNPSTGIMSIYFLLKHIDFKSLTIYGFEKDYKSGTWYHNLKTQKWHNFEEEYNYFNHWINKLYKKNVKML